MFSLICAWINVWVNNRKAGHLRRHHAYYDVTVKCGASSPSGLSFGKAVGDARIDVKTVAASHIITSWFNGEFATAPISVIRVTHLCWKKPKMISHGRLFALLEPVTIMETGIKSLLNCEISKNVVRTSNCIRQLPMKICAEHGSMTALLCATFQKTKTEWLKDKKERQIRFYYILV